MKTSVVGVTIRCSCCGSLTFTNWPVNGVTVYTCSSCGHEWNEADNYKNSAYITETTFENKEEYDLAKKGCIHVKQLIRITSENRENQGEIPLWPPKERGVI